MLCRLGLLFVMALPAGAQEAGVTLPAIPPLPPGEARHLLDLLVMANVVAWNCPGIAETAAPRLLLAGSRDLVVQTLEMDDPALDRVYAPMLAAVDKPGFCAAQAPRLGVILDMLVFWGGSLRLER
jgi:hypothetical protein